MIIENLIKLLGSVVIAGCWWFAAIRLGRYWFLYAIAAVATVGPLLSSGMTAASQMMHGSAASSTIQAISHVWTLLVIIQAVLFVIFVSWLVKSAGSNPAA